MSWKNLVIQSGERIALSTLITWGVGSRDPSLLIDSNLVSPTNWATTYTITGNAVDPEGIDMTIRAVPDDDIGRLKILGRNVASSSQFAYPLKFQDFNVRSGQHYVDVYAVDISGTISPGVRFMAQVVAPTLPLTRTPPQTAPPSPTGGRSRSRTPLPTRTPYPTPPPLRTAPADLRMVVTADVDSHTNFRLQAEGPSLNGDIVHVSNTGWNSRYFLSTGDSGRLARLAPVFLDNVFIGTRVTPIGASAVVAYEILNFGSDAISINMSLDTDVNLNENDDAPIHTLDDRNGFRIEGGLLHFRVYTRAYPLVVDADAFWFGSFFELDDHLWDQADGTFRGDDSACSVTWQNRVVPPQGRIVLSALMTWYGDSQPPSLNMGSTNLPGRIDWQAQFTLSGTVSQANGNDCHLAMVANNDFGFIWPIGDAIRSGSSFSYSFTPAQLGLGGGAHSFDIYAFDQRGAVAAPLTFAFEVLAPTMQPTFTAQKSPTRSRSFQGNTPNPTLDPSGGGGGGDAGGGGEASVASGDANSAVRAAVAVLIPLSAVIILIFGYLLFCQKKKGFAPTAEKAVALNDVGSYTI
jgi:hypothetical protein